MKLGHRFLMGALVTVLIVAVLALIAATWQNSLAADGIIYVDSDATGANDGASWADAFTTLQPALELAVTGDQIWVAEGIYIPTVEHGGTGDRFKSFQLKNSVALYRGFDPSVGDVAWGDRDWAGNVTILNGDLNGDDGPDFANNGENSYHVFYHPDGTALDHSAILDGFTISGGNADGDNPHDSGGGMVNEFYSSPTLTNCAFIGNSATFGGGMYNYASSPTLTKCSFEGNSAENIGGSGGGMYNFSSSSPTLVDCTFTGNSADNYGGSGGGMYNHLYSSPTLTNCTFTGNSADYNGAGGGLRNSVSSPILTNCTFTGNSATYGGGMVNYDSSPTLTNCTFLGNSATFGGGISNTSSSPTLANTILWGNTLEQILEEGDCSSVITYSDIQGGCPTSATCMQVIDADPRFVRNPSPGTDGQWGTADDDYGDLHLKLFSPAIDAGNNSAVPAGIITDLLGDPRFVDIVYALDTGLGTPPIVDMGAYETQFVGSPEHIYLPMLVK